MNITLAYQGDRNDIDFGVSGKKDGLKLLTMSARELSASTKKKVRTDSCYRGGKVGSYTELTTKSLAIL